MSIDENFVVGNKVSFSTYIPAIIGKQFNNVEVLGIVSYRVAKLQNPLIDAWHSSGIGNLESGVSSNPKDLTYVMLESIDGSQSVLAFDWIDNDSVQVSGTKTYNVTIANATPEKIEKIRRIATIELGLTFNYQA